MTKVFPLVAVPVALAWLVARGRRREAWRARSRCAATIAVVARRRAGRVARRRRRRPPLPPRPPGAGRELAGDGAARARRARAWARRRACRAIAPTGSCTPRRRGGRALRGRCWSGCVAAAARPRAGRTPRELVLAASPRTVAFAAARQGALAAVHDLGAAARRARARLAACTRSRRPWRAAAVLTQSSSPPTTSTWSRASRCAGARRASATRRCWPRSCSRCASYSRGRHEQLLDRGRAAVAVRPRPAPRSATGPRPRSRSAPWSA